MGTSLNPDEFAQQLAGDIASDLAEAQADREWEAKLGEQRRRREEARERRRTEEEEARRAEEWNDPVRKEALLRRFIENSRDNPDRAELVERAEEELRRMHPPAVVTVTTHVGNREAPRKPAPPPQPVRLFQNHEELANSLLSSLFGLARISLDRDISQSLSGGYQSNW